MSLSIIFGSVERLSRAEHAQNSPENRQVVGGRIQEIQPSPVANGLPVLRQINIGRRILRVDFDAKSRYAHSGSLC